MVTRWPSGLETRRRARARTLRWRARTRRPWRVNLRRMRPVRPDRTVPPNDASVTVRPRRGVATTVPAGRQAPAGAQASFSSVERPPRRHAAVRETRRAPGPRDGAVAGFGYAPCRHRAGGVTIPPVASDSWPGSEVA